MSPLGRQTLAEPWRCRMSRSDLGVPPKYGSCTRRTGASLKDWGEHGHLDPSREVAVGISR
jgi:hypothetical protein